MKKIRICSPELGLSPQSVLGGEVHDREILKALAKLGVEVEILLPKNRPYNKTIKNWQVKYASIKHIFPAYLFNLLVIPYLFKTYKEKQFRILRIHSPYFVGPAALFFKLFHKEVVLIPSYHLKEKNPFFNLINKLTMKKWDRVITVSHYLKKTLVDDYQVDSKKIKVIYNGVSSIFKPQKKDSRLVKKLGLKGKRVLLYVGLLTKRKNVGFLFDVLAKIKKEYPKAILLICGDGPEKKKLIRQAERWQLNDRVIFTGPYYSKDLVKIFNLADIFVFPSKNEGFGLVVAEAMACKKPVIVSNNSSLPEIVDEGKNGFLAETNNLKDWEKKLRILIENKSLREEFGKKGRRKILKSFSWEKAAQKTYKFYKNLLKKYK